jgi:hypothetical protein
MIETEVVRVPDSELQENPRQCSAGQEVGVIIGDRSVLMSFDPDRSKGTFEDLER